MQQSTVTSRGQTTLPKAVREALGLRAGDTVRYLVLPSGEVRLFRARALRDLAGSLQRPGQAVLSIEAMDDAIAEVTRADAGA